MFQEQPPTARTIVEMVTHYVNVNGIESARAYVTWVLSLLTFLITELPMPLRYLLALICGLVCFYVLIAPYASSRAYRNVLNARHKSR